MNVRNECSVKFRSSRHASVILCDTRCLRKEWDLLVCRVFFCVVMLCYVICAQIWNAGLDSSAQLIVYHCHGWLSNLGRRPAGKPRNGWDDEVLGDAVKLIGRKNWRETARHSSGWRRKKEEAMKRNGAEEQYEEEKKKLLDLLSLSVSHTFSLKCRHI